MSTTATPLRLMLVDDEAPARARLRDLLSDIADEQRTQVVAEAAEGATALRLATESRPEIALIDINMPGMSGIELARHLSKLEQPPAIIFVTAYDQYAVQAFDLAALDYLLKPARAPRLLEALRKARRRTDENERLQQAADATRSERQHLSCLERGRILLVPVADILYLRAEQKYVVARTAERSYLLEESLVHLEAEFGDRFLRIHRNCLVGRPAVAGVERVAESADSEAHWEILLQGVSDRLPVSRRLWPQVKMMLNL